MAITITPVQARGVAGWKPVAPGKIKFNLVNVPDTMDVVNAYVYRLDQHNPHLLPLTTESGLTVQLRVGTLVGGATQHDHIVIGKIVEMRRGTQNYHQRIGWYAGAILRTAGRGNGALIIARMRNDIQDPLLSFT